MTISNQKAALRKAMLLKRAELLAPEKVSYDRWICRKLWQMIQDADYQTVHCYLPMGDEVNIYPLIAQMLEESITVVAPKTLPKGQLLHLVLQDLHQLEKGIFGTSHPAGSAEYLGRYDLIIVPGLAFDRAHRRLGYGGGYYDQFLAQHPEAYKLGICYPFQLMESIPYEGHDVVLDQVICPTEKVL